MRTARVTISHREQSLKEFPVALEGDPKILGRSFFAATPLLFKARTRFGEAGGELFDDVRHQAVCLLDAAFGIVDETRLDAVPTRTQSRELIIGEKRSVRRCFGLRP